MGCTASGTGELVFDDCHVPRTALLGSERGGFKRAMESLNTGRVGIGAQAVGVAQAALDAALAYAKTREAFGRPIAELQAIQFLLADMSDAGRGRAPARAAGSAPAGPRPLDRARGRRGQADGGRDGGEASPATRCRSTAPAGYATDFPIERLYRDARVYPIFEGTSQIQRLVIARQLLRERS